MNKLLVWLFGCIVVWWFDLDCVRALPQESLKESEPSETRFTFTPLAEQLLTQPTAKQLGDGEVSINLDTRTFFFPDMVESGIDDDDSAVNFNTGFSWGISDSLQLTLQFQHVDSSSPSEQGDFAAERTEDNEAALELKQRIWTNSAQTKALSGVFAASWGTRGFLFTDNGEATEINNRDIFISVAIPLTADLGDRWQFNLAPTLAFFKDESAVFFHRLPDDDENTFGTVVGLGSGVSFRASDRLSLFGDVFLPLTGNNSIDRDSGEPARAIVYNAGLRFLTNPRLALDLYASNTFASYAPLSLTGDRDFMGLGANLVFMPDLVSANRRYEDSFKNSNREESITTDGLAFFDGGTLPSGKIALQVQGGSQGILTALRYSPLRDFEAGIFLDYIAGEVDESEQGIAAKVRLLDGTEVPITLSIAATASLTNQPFVNFRSNDADAFERSDLDKTVPFFTPGGDNTAEGKLLLFTFSAPVHYQIAKDTAVWLTPILGYVQREGIETGGFSLGGAIALSREVSLTGEIGANFVGEGNSFIDGRLEDRIPWTMGVRWTPLTLLDIQTSEDNSDPFIELYLTNRVGSSPWHQLRVREENEIGVGVGLFAPF